MNGEKKRVVDHLVHDFTEPIRDPLWQHIYVSPAVKELISCAPFQKLGRIKQLGPAYHVYPGAVHTRLNHSLGVFHLSRKLLLALYGHEDFEGVSIEGAKAFLSAAVLHDLGHFPFAHSLKELPLKEHEALTAEGVLAPPLRETLREKVGCDPQRVAAIVDEDMDASDDEEVLFFRRLLSGVLDPDKLDYLNRDAYFCGVPYGVQDTEFVFNKIVPHPENGIAVESAGLTAVENILFSKYLMYKTVYWHRVVRIATAMIKQPVFTAMREGIITREELYWLDDEEFFRTLTPERYRPFELLERTARRELLKTAWEGSFNRDNGEHLRLMDLDHRSKRQEEIARTLSSRLQRSVRPWEVIIDIPEPISFEIGLPIGTEAGFLPFPRTASVFGGPAVESFSRTLRKIRLFLPAGAAEEGPAIGELIGGA
jgi:HD superfamily phosphohydrolase